MYYKVVFFFGGDSNIIKKILNSVCVHIYLYSNFHVKKI